MKGRMLAGLAMVAAPALAVAGAGAGAGQAPSVQQQYEAANALDANGTPEQRVAAWDALLKRVGTNKRSAALIRVRKASALLAMGRKDEAAADVQAGLADLPANDQTLRADRFRATFQLGAIADSAIDYPAALERYRAAEALAVSPGEKLSALIGLIKVETFLDPDAAAQSAGRAQALLAAHDVARTRKRKSAV